MEEETTQIGKQIGNYHLIEKIGSGNLGTVYQAHHTLTNHVVALKLLHVHLPDPQHERFMQEVQLLESLQHPYILSVAEIGLDDDRPYIATEYAPGGSLRQRLNETRVFSWEQALTILNQTGEALGYAYKQKIVHSDLKPENILFNAQGEVVVTDFGIASILSTMGIKPFADQGSNLSYLAPEQIRGKATKNSDQYALACIAYEMLTGQLPFSAPDLRKVGRKQKKEPPTPPRKINAEIPKHGEYAILTALAERRGSRHEDTATFLQELQTPPPPHEMAHRLFLRALRLTYTQKHQEAIETYEELLLLDPNHTDAYAHLGNVLLEHERYEEAMQAYGNAIRLGTESLGVYMNRASTLFKLERYEEAVETYDQALRIQPNNPVIYNSKGSVLYKLERLEEAVEAFDQALRLNPTYVVACMNKGNILHNLGRYEEAVDSYDQALDLYPNIAGIHHDKGHALYNLKRYEEAVQAYDQALRIDPNNFVTYSNKGHTLYSLKRYEEAAEAFEQVMHLDPGNRDAFHGKMLALLAQETEALRLEMETSRQAADLDPNKEQPFSRSAWDERILETDKQALDIGLPHTEIPNMQSDAQENIDWNEEALKSFEEALGFDPNNACALNGKGEILVRLKRHEEALEPLERALGINPDYAMAYKNMGNALLGLERYEEAIGAFEQALSANPKKVFAAYNKKTDLSNPHWFTEMMVRDMDARLQAIEVDHASVYDNKGDALYHLDRYEEAIEAYEQATRIDPTNVTAHNSKGNALSKLERNEEALQVYEHILRIDPNDAITYNNKGASLYCLNRYEEALETHQQALDLDPNNAVIHTNKGRALSRLKRYKEALASFEQALHLDPDYISAYEGKAMALYHLDRVEEAAEVIEEVHRNDAEFYNRKGMAMLDLNEYEEALSAFEQALRIDPNHVDASSNKSFILALRRVHKIGKDFGLG